MSKIDTLYAGCVVDYDFQHLIEHEQKLSPSWSIQNIAFPLGVHSPLTAKLPKPPATQAQPPPVAAEGIFNRNWDEHEDIRFSLRATHEPGFNNPLALGYLEAEPFVAGGGFETVGSPAAIVAATAILGQPFDDFDNEVEQSSSNDVDNNSGGGNMDLPFTYSEGPCETAESICNPRWDDVDELVHELTTRLGDSPSPPVVRVTSDDAELKFSRDDGGPLQATPEVRLSGLIGNNISGPNDQSSLIERVHSVESHTEILSALSTIQWNLNRVKAVVPHLPDEQHQWTVLVRKHAVDAVGAVELFSQIADLAVSNAPDHHRQREVIQKSEQAGQQQQQQQPQQVRVRTHNNFDENEKTLISSGGFASPEIALAGAAPGNLIEKCAAAVSRSGAVGVLPVGAISKAPPVACVDKMELMGAPELGAREQEASSWAADLLESGSRPGLKAVKFATNESWIDGKQLGDETFKAVSSTEYRLKRAKPASFDDDDFAPPTGLAETAGTSASREQPGSATGVPLSTGSPGESEEGDTPRGEDLPEGSYILMEIDDLEILTEQTHFCNICCKGFKRDANLRMHMRSHGGKFKTSAALVRTEKPPKVAQEMVDGKPTRYSCPYLGCNRNMKHPKFQALKTMLCLKNHYRRSHCQKTLRCSICKIKQFSVVADLRTHEKHCGSDRWACSCGTIFSRKEKLFGHISLFVGHVPVDAAMASHVVTEVDMSAAAAGTELEVSPVQLEGIVEQPQQLVPRGESSSLWHGWENDNDLYK